MIPTISLRGANVSRLIIGGNPFSGNSHLNQDIDEEMMSFFTTAKIKETLFRCQESGIGTMQLRGDRHIMRILREYRAEGGTMNWVGQTTPEALSYDNNIRQMADFGACAIYHHGTVTDELFKKGELDELQRRLAVIRNAGLPVGLGTHMPEVIRYADEHKWDVDFYMACVYNLSRADRVSSAVSGIANSDEPFFEEDIPVMYETVRNTDKPCLVFKILGATRRCATQATVQAAFDECFASMKPTDAVVVGMYPKNEDQPALNAQYTMNAIRKSQER